MGWVGAAGRTWESESATSISEITARRPLWQSQRAIKHGFLEHNSATDMLAARVCSMAGDAALAEGGSDNSSSPKCTAWSV